jgi:predicted transcriptional regulator
VFLRQEGHLSADDLVDLIRREDHRISRATVYRTLQWMVDAGIARKVDFGEGRFRFEHSYRQPRHFHLICKTCHRSFEFLSSDIEALVEEIAAARAASRPRRASCRSTAPARSAAPAARGRRAEQGTPICCSRAMRCASRLPPSAAASSSTAARAGHQRRPRPQGVPGPRDGGAGAPRQARGALPRAAARDPQLESRPTFLFFKGAANGIFAEGAERLLRGVNDQQALMIGIRCERGSHRFFKKYGERFEDSEGKQIFLEFADEERAHLDLLRREYRALVKRQGRTRRRARTGAAARAR